MLLLAGCTSAAPTQPTSAPPATSSATATSTPVVAVTVPAHLTGEISRDVFTGTSYTGRIGAVPRSATRLSLHLACAGPGGSQMRYTIQNGKGAQYSAGAVSCDGHEHLDTDEGGDFPPVAVLDLDADPHVTNGWAVLTHP